VVLAERLIAVVAVKDALFSICSLEVVPDMDQAALLVTVCPL
jgi:hypothetical protein